LFIQTPDGRYPEKPNDVHTVPEDAAIATVADCDGDKAGEIVFMGPNGISALGTSGGKFTPAPANWISTTTSTLFADREGLPLWGLCGDFHRNGHHEIAVWGVGTLSFYRAEGGRWVQIDKLKVAPEAHAMTQPNGTFRGSAAQPDISFATTFAYPE